MNTPESRKRAMAYCDKLFWIAKRAHEIGLPNNLLKPKARSITTLSGHPVEVKLKFTERLQKVKDIIGSNKHIALDVLRGERLDDIVWAPISSVKRKESNTKGNGRKSVALVKAKDKKQGLVGGIKVTDATNATDGADAEDGDVEAVEEEESSEDTVVKSSAKRKRTA
ncbi:hypothetical protein BAUCODRAFT_38874 [Baudoinia panamericana UAMH 10762]|uniref:Uncharacterized protein n=1 Tax=Baudoinia panamericana (strain UAMH 10762) TaxID=717646 RepID=M2MYK1_BAUPA|nr:uncharacterized protein BAUCODRAFT_38874 [Baudoinia panamericana UAMH 10762]EMC91739.1 hypothetical protein BAUCODRAFT_38874 [Baudoinia panamericana UAMH 10762]